MRAIKFIKNGEEHYIGTVSKEYVDKKEDCKVELFPIPAVGDSIKSLWEYLNTYKDEKIEFFIQRDYGGWKHRVITSMTVDYSADGPFGTIIAEGNDQVMYIEYSTIAGEPDVDTYCDSITIHSCHDELVASVDQDQNDGTMVVCNEGNPYTGTVVHISCGTFAYNTLSSISFDNGTTTFGFVYPSGSTILGNEFNMTGDDYYFELTGLVVNDKIYVWDFYKKVNAQ